MKLRLHTLLIICCALLSTPRVSAQIDSLVFIADSARVQPEAKGELRVSIDALAFFRDNEYNSADVTRGYTLPGEPTPILMPTIPIWLRLSRRALQRLFTVPLCLEPIYKLTHT